MKVRINNLQGQRFGRLTVLKDSGKRTRGNVIWVCLCSCGKVREALASHLKRRHTRSCGCLQRELASKRFATHGESKTKLYRVWHNIKKRCYNPRAISYKYYGGKGIILCSEWHNDYLAFKTWALANGYKESLTLGRKDKNENYTPENCRWITRSKVAKAGNLQGKRFGRLTALRDSGKRACGCVIWACLCDCGNFTEVSSNSLKRGDTRSCGCLKREKMFKHGGTKTRLYATWKGMKRRCYSPKFRNYKCYGGRGIQVCTEWKNDFIAFRNWALNNGYADNLTIDRIDNNGNYEPSNCQFLTRPENSKKEWKDLKKARKRLFIMMMAVLMRKKRMGWI